MERVVGRGLPDQTTEPLDPSTQNAPKLLGLGSGSRSRSISIVSLSSSTCHMSCLAQPAACRRTTDNRLEDGPVRVPIWDSTFIPLPGTALFATVAVTTTIAVHLLLAAAACTASASYRRPCDARQSALRSQGLSAERWNWLV